MSEALRVTDLCKRYGGRGVVDGVSFEVAPGELVALMGPSGSGKSTVLRIIAGLLEPDRGSVRSGSDDLLALPPGERDVAMVFQSYALFPHLTIFDNLAFGLRARGVAENELRGRVEPVAAALGLEAMLDRHPRALSGGERQRVALGRAMLRQPRVFLLDEPLSNLDAQLRIQMRAQIAELQRRIGVATLYVTHDQVEAMSLGARVGVLREGRLEQLAPPRELYERPATVFVARFVGNPGMNILRADVRGGQARVGDTVVAQLGRPDGPVLLGVRPEHVALGPGVSARVVAREQLGDHLLVTSQVGEQRVVARLPSDASVPDEVSWSLPPARLRWFDAETERALDDGGASR